MTEFTAHPTLERDPADRHRYRANARHVLEPALARLTADDQTVGYLVADRRTTFANAGARARAMVQALRNAGISAGEPVALIGMPSERWIGAALGILASGAVLAPVDHTLMPGERSSLLEAAGISWTVISDDRPATGTKVLGCPTPSRGDPRLELVGEGDDPAIILHTSGTTGAPKGVVLTHSNLIQSLLSFLDVFGCTGSDRTCIAVPLYHVTGLIDQFLQMLWLGGMCRLLPRYDTDAMVRSLVEDEITYLVAVPAVFSLIVRRPPRTPLSLQLALYGGAPMNVQTVRALVELVPRVRPIQGYGMTEITSLATALPEDQALRAPASVGVPSPITEVRLIDEHGGEVTGPDVLGEILLRGPHRTPGYWRRPDLTAQAIDGQGWLRSGDIAWRDESGLLYLAGRKNQMINRGGEKISPRELEHALMEVPGVADAVAFGIPDEVLHEAPGAAVIPAEGSSLDERLLQDALRDRLAPFKRPIRIWILDAFPLSATGKVNVAAIRRKGTQ